MHDETSDPRTMIRLRFMAEAAIEVLSGSTGEAYASQAPIPPDATEEMLRTLLGHAVPVLRATVHQQLANQIEAFLAEPQDDERPPAVLRSDVLLTLAFALCSALAAFLFDFPELGSPGEILSWIKREA